MAELLRNGWFVNENGVLFAIIEGSAYELETRGTAFENVKIPPGDYATDEELSKAAGVPFEKDDEEEE